MARKKKANRSEDDEPTLDISSLIDVCFLLLIYFLVTTTIQKAERDVALQAPGAPNESSEPPPIPPLMIIVEENGTIATRSDGVPEELDKEDGTFELPLLDNVVALYAAAAKASNSKAIVQLRSENDSKVQRTVSVLNTLMKYGITNIAMTDLVDPES